MSLVNIALSLQQVPARSHLPCSGVCGRGGGYFPECSCRTTKSWFGALAFEWGTTRNFLKCYSAGKNLQRWRFLLKLRHKMKPCVHSQGNQSSLVNSRKVHCGTHARQDNICWAKSMSELHFPAFSWGEGEIPELFLLFMILFCVKVFLSFFSFLLNLSSPTASHHIVIAMFCCTQCYRIHRECHSSTRIHKENTKYHRLTWLGAPCGKWEETIDEIYDCLPNLDSNSFWKQQGTAHPNLWDRFCQSQHILL